jgi:hypothetical protein
MQDSRLVSFSCILFLFPFSLLQSMNTNMYCFDRQMSDFIRQYIIAILVKRVTCTRRRGVLRKRFTCHGSSITLKLCPLNKYEYIYIYTYTLKQKKVE